MNDYTPIDLSKVTTRPLGERPGLVGLADFGKPWIKGSSFADFLQGLPTILAANDIRSVIQAIAMARQKGHPVIMAMGAHVIKVGLNPIVIDLMERGILTGIAMNGAGIIHDFEVAMTGRTSEDVAATLEDGSFGMARETAQFLSQAISQGAARDQGLGAAVGQAIDAQALPHRSHSILAAGYRLQIPVTIHIAMGTDIIHMHPDFDPAAAGKASHRDFRILASEISQLEGGVYLNVGSAVLLPEVFLKAVTLVRNLGHSVKSFTTVNMDFIRHYRPMTNVVNRPTLSGGKGYNLVGHHEIMFPLIAAGVLEQLQHQKA